MPKFLSLICCLLFFIGCTGDADQTVHRAFYHWQTKLELGDKEQEVLKELNVEYLYVKYFDLIWNYELQQPQPVAKVINPNSASVPAEIVPVVFVTTESLSPLNDADIDDLARRMCKLIEQLHQHHSNTAPEWIQIDCDWTPSTRDQYFRLLEKMKSYPGFAYTKWSATIRLHQFRYPQETGVPPVNRGLLMFYNMGDIKDPNATHSIYDKEMASSYLDEIGKYPIPLDAGIALYSWGLYFHEGTLQHIFYPLTANEINGSLFAKVQDNRYSVRMDGYFRSHFVNKGDQLRLETMTPEKSLESARQLAKVLQDDSISVILYHLDSSILQAYTHEDLTAIYRVFE
jgi:hypothetical protein